jgi:biopolymer transport protein ExbD
MVLPKLPTVRAKRGVGTVLSEINVTPLVDVMLVLLVIFMITTPMMQSGIGVSLPQAETDTAPAEEGVKVTVTPDRNIYIGSSVININLLERRLRESFAGKPKKVVFLSADQSLSFGFVIEVMDIIKKSGVEVVGLMTELKESKVPRK